MIYLKSFFLLAPFNNDVIQTISFHWEYWKTYGFTHIMDPKNRLFDSLGTRSNKFLIRHSSAKLGEFTLSDFEEQTRPGDTSSVYVFSVISTNKEIVDRTIEQVRRSFVKHTEKITEQGHEHSVSEIKETIFAFDGIGCEDLSPQKKIEKWAELLETFPYVSKVYNWLLVNRNYPVVT